VLDLGCGYGDLKVHLDARFCDVDYLGVDFLTEFVTEATRRHGNLPGTRFVQADFMASPLPQADVVVASGSLNYRAHNPHHPKPTIERMWKAARKGVAFNLLDRFWIPDDELVSGYDPFAMLEFCRSLCPTAELLNDYLPDDFTILMRK
jgi:trans-aconitate methyltransferase